MLEFEDILAVLRIGQRFTPQPDFNPRPKREMGRVIAQIGVPPRGRLQDFDNQDFFPFTGSVPEYGGYDIHGQGQFNFPVPSGRHERRGLAGAGLLGLAGVRRRR